MSRPCSIRVPAGIPIVHANLSTSRQHNPPPPDIPITPEAVDSVRCSCRDLPGSPTWAAAGQWSRHSRLGRHSGHRHTSFPRSGSLTFPLRKGFSHETDTDVAGLCGPARFRYRLLLFPGALRRRRLWWRLWHLPGLRLRARRLRDRIVHHGWCSSGRDVRLWSRLSDDGCTSGEQPADLLRLMRGGDVFDLGAFWATRAGITVIERPPVSSRGRFLHEVGRVFGANGQSRPVPACGGV